jgi:hypothetical protein
MEERRFLPLDDDLFLLATLAKKFKEQAKSQTCITSTSS